MDVSSGKTLRNKPLTEEGNLKQKLGEILGKPSKEGSLDLESGKVLGKPSKEANTDRHSHSNKKGEKYSFVEALKKPLQEGNGSFFNHVVSSDSMKNFEKKTR